MSPKYKRFLKYSFFGMLSFVLDLILLYLLVEIGSLLYGVAASISFVIASSVNYVLSRTYVFQGTVRDMQTGYALFVFIGFVGLGMVVMGMYVFVEYFAFHYIVARILVGGFVGLWNYAMNLYVNFKVVGLH